MVMSTDTSNEEVQEQAPQPEPFIEDLSDETEAPEGDEQVAPTDGQAAEEPQNAVAASGETTTDSGQELPALDPVPQPQTGQQEQELAELHRHRMANAQKEWETQQIRQAQAIERRAVEQGADPQSARSMARQHLSHQKALRDQDGKALDLIQFVEGRNNAAMHYAQKYKLLPKQALEDMKALTKLRSPQEMDIEAKRMAQFRSQAAEIQRLKQGSVKPQTFDSSQGSAEVTTNQDRLLESYLRGDRSEAARAAARKLTLGT